MEGELVCFPTEVKLVEGLALVEHYISMAFARKITIDDSTIEYLKKLGLTDYLLLQMQDWETENTLIELNLRSRTQEE